MNIVGVRVKPWESVREFAFEEDVEKGERVVVEEEIGYEDGEVVFVKASEKATGLPRVTRKLSASETQKVKEYQAREGEVLSKCRELVKRHELPMKLVGAKFTFDGSRLTFAFTADSRVDFRQLVKDLTRTFQKSVRLQQIGSRDEARGKGGMGHCGKEICCGRFLEDMQSITTDMAAKQDLAHRGSDRLSGICGRLMCCLSFEEGTYEDLAKKFPSKGDIVYDRVNKIQGKVIDRNMIKGFVTILDKDQNSHKSEVEDLKIKARAQIYNS